jgi:HEAT repeat protein
MSKLALLLLTMCFTSGAGVFAAAQERSEVQQLVSELLVEKTTDKAADKLRQAALGDKDVRQLLVNLLPPLAEKVRGEVWLNTVHLCGDLKIVEAVPALTRLLMDPWTKGGPTNFGMAFRLGDDPPGRALADIGEPSTEPVAVVLQDERDYIRWRAAVVLGNIDSARTEELLELHLPDETDRSVVSNIETRIEEHQKRDKP